MPYRDLDRRRATTKARVRRYRQRWKQAEGVTGMRSKALHDDTMGVTEGVTLPVLDADGQEMPEYD